VAENELTDVAGKLAAAGITINAPGLSLDLSHPWCAGL